MNLREERGAFWWYGEPIAQGESAPPSAVAGQLFIDEQGRSRLELDSNLSHGTANSPRPVAFDPMPEGAAIAGIIKDKNQHVLLSGLSKSGFNLSMMSHETFRAENCMIGDRPFPARDTFSQLRSLEIDLTGFETWVGLRSIEFTSKRGSITVKYKKPKDLVYPLDDGKLSIRYYINRPFNWKDKTHALTLTELATLYYGFSGPRTLKDVKAQYGLLEEWLILMTNSEHSLDWPEVTVKSKDFRYKLYFFREQNTASPPEMFDCFPPLSLVRGQLGQLFSAWKEKRDKYGSAFVLYVASRRGFRLYTENRFINFIWAMESYHRTKYPPQSTNLDAKIQEIMAQVDKKHKRWLARQLRNAGEPNLEQRVLEIITSLPLKLEGERCKQFAGACQSRRNDLSHFGGRRDNTNPYDEFHGDLYLKSQALFYLLHVLVLQELGIAADILNRFVYHSHASLKIKHAFAAVGLLDKSVLTPPPMEIPTLQQPAAAEIV